MVDIPAPVSSAYVSPNETLLEVDHKLGIGNYTINDAQGSLVFNVKGPAFVGRDVWRFLGDASGKDLVFLKNKVGSWHDRWFAYRCTDARTTEGNLLFTMSKSSVFQMSPVFDIFLPTNETPVPDFVVKGNFWERDYRVLFRGAPIAEAKKRFNVAFPVVVGKDHYKVTIYPGVDQAFLASVVVIINEVKEDKRREIMMY